MELNRVFVVEGRSDAANISKVCKANFIITHGIHLSHETYNEIELAAKTVGIIVFSDPDGPGNSIRRKIDDFIEKKRAKNGDIYRVYHAHLSTDEARRNGDIGVENASEESLLRALAQLRTERRDEEEKGREFIYQPRELDDYGLIGHGSKRLREALCKELHLGYANGKMLLKKLNSYHIARTDLEEAIKKIKRENI